MSPVLRVLLIILSFFTLWFTLRKIRKSQIQISDSIFWIFFGFFLVGISIFPQAVHFMAKITGVQSPVNFIFLSIFFILILKQFSSSIKMSQLENKISLLTQKIGLSENEERNEKRKDNQDEEI